MKANFFTICFLLFLLPFAKAQIINGQDTLYGNEWINFDQSYFKIMVAEDGIYRIPQQTLATANLPLNQINGDQFQLFHNGEEVPIYVTTDGPLGGSDFIEFFGKKNTSELDRHLFKDPDAEMMNPLYSLFTDTSAYFLTWKPTSGNLRYETIANDLTNLPPKEEYCWFTIGQVFSNSHDKKRNSEGVRNSYFDVADGFASGYALTQNINILPLQPFVGNQDAKLDIRFGCGLGDHSQTININGVQVWQEDFYDFAVKQQSFDIASAYLTGQVQISVLGYANSNDKSRIANATLRYPRLFNFSALPIFAFELDADSEPQYLEISNFITTGGATPVLYDLTNHIRIETTLDGNLIKVVLPPSVLTRKLILVNQVSGVKTVNILTPVQFIDYFDSPGDYIILSNAKLFDDGAGVNFIQEYADYRASVAGGSYLPVVVEIQQVYDQFGWGLNRHSLAIRNFALYINKNWDNPKYLFIIGKGREFQSTRASAALSNPNHLPLLVPTFGSPGSDNQLMASNWSLKPMIPVGRLPAVNPVDVKLYLDKVKAFEANKSLPQTISDRQWMKRVMHLGGGAEGGEQSIIRSNLGAMEDIIENNSFGANVFSFFKTSTDPIQVSQTQAITDLINGGVSLMTLFGHASAGGFDFTVDDPSTYTNHGKFPLIISLGCFSGQFHGQSQSVGERFVLQENRGAIGFIATSGYGFVNALNQVTRSFYEKLGGEFYGQGIGNTLQSTFGEFQQSDFGTEVLAQQFTLHGDPAIVLNAFSAPDFIADAGSVAISPVKINAQQSDFTFLVKVANLGKAVNDSLTLDVKREFPNGSTLLVERRRIPSPKYETELAFTVPVLGKQAIGFNKLFVDIDPENLIPEQNQPQAENNNFLVSSDGGQGYHFYVFANGAIPVYPDNFSIVSNEQLILKGVTSNVFAPEQRYFMELDTTELFDSPLKKTTVIVKTGGVLEWQPDILWSDNVVYYWRISPDTIDGQGFIWANSSFLFLKNIREGWNQSHYFQIKKDQFSNTELPENTRRLKYIDDFKIVRYYGGAFATYYPQWFIGEEYYYYLNSAPAVTGGVYITVFDSLTVNTWYNSPPGLYGSQIPQGIYFPLFPFPTQTEQQREKVINFLKDTIPSGNYVMLVTIQHASGSNYEPEEWAADSLVFGTNLFQLLEQQGAMLIRSTSTTGARPYVVMYKKDDPSFLTKEKMVGVADLLEENFSLPGTWNNGYVESTLIGPAEKWDSLAWSTREFDPVFDKQQLDVYGVKSDSSKVLLYENVQSSSLDFSQINPSEYPFLRLRYITSDSVERTSPQLDYWRVFFKGLPDAAIDPSSHFSFVRDTLQEGELLQLETAIRNLTQNDMDSLLVKFSVINNSNQLVEKLLRLPPILSEGQVRADFQLNTKGIRGKQQLWMEINPNLDQPELHTFNNVAIREFFVETDRRNPVVDVTFDGIHILNGDLVSARPHIVVNVEDENPFLALDDTLLFKVFLQYPDTSILVAMPFDGQILKFIPAGSQSGKNKAILELNPHFTTDGTYQLIVQSRDVSNNASGQYDYKISFEVITKSMISSVLNYPNPFSTSTRFVYTLTGEELPTQFKIQILTISGKIVREITQDEIGQLRIGTHKTDFAWDGRDEFGDRLANGVYLYRVMAKKANGEEFEPMANEGADKYFNKGFGKMVIVN